MSEQKLLRRKAKAQSQGNQILLAKTCIDLGELYMKTGQYNAAIEEFVIVARVYEETGRKIDYASAHRMIGEAYMQISEFDRALEHQQIHLNVAVEEEDKHEEQRALANLGHIYLTKYLDVPEKNSLRLAYASLQKSFEVCERLTNIEKREQLDMKARLLANMGVVQECQKNYEKALDLVRRSIQICKENNLCEQLQRSYKMLGSLYKRKEEWGSAINNYNLAIDTAERLPNKTDLTCEVLTEIADVLIRVGDLRGAKTKLRKAYNLQSTNIVERDTIERNLKTVAAMCYMEDSIETTSPSDHKALKKLYEKLGDGACQLKQYPKAIEYYKKMLEQAELNGDTGKELTPCYISLAQTYKDQGAYKESIKYFQKEYKVNKNNVEESVATLLNIAEVLEKDEQEVGDVDNVYSRIREKCVLGGAQHLEARTLKRHAEFLRNKNRTEEAEKLERELLRLDHAPSDDEEDEETNTPNVGGELDIDDITDVEEEAERREESRRTRTRGAVKVKRNAKGETQMHTACINGNVVEVRKLLEQGCPINERDYCGWLPIHEACIYGHLEIVKLLVEHKADFNDRGGKGCLGVTPLHDACTNGHLHVVQYLLDHGASVIARTDDGKTPLHFLKHWRESADDLSDEDARLYDGIVKLMGATLERFGQKAEPGSGSTTAAYENGEEATPSKRGRRRASQTPGSAPRKAGKKSTPRKVGEARRRLCDGGEEEVVGVATSNVEEVSAKDEYKQVMDNLRRRSNSTSSSIEKKKRKSDEMKAQPAHVGYDDWLEDDLGVSSAAKKRKPSSAASDLLYTSNTRQSTPETADSTDSEAESRTEFPADRRPKRKKQTSLIKAGFTRSKTSQPVAHFSGAQPPARRPERANSVDVGGRKAEADSSSCAGAVEVAVQVKQSPMLSVDVKIEEKLYRVPVPAAEVNSCTIRWLAEEASKRYFKREGIRPTLELETKNGAILADEDLVSMLFPMGSMHAEELKATILKRTLPPLLDRYDEACVQNGTAANEELRTLLQETSTVLDLSDRSFQSAALLPLCKAVNRQSNLIELNFSGNFMTDECLQLLCASLPSLTNLMTLNLSLNHLTADGLKSLGETFTNSDRPILENLIGLNLSYNPIFDDGFRHLAVISRYLRLRALDLSSVNLSTHIFEKFHNKNVELYLGNVETLNISHNELNKNEIVRFVSWLNPGAIEELDVSNNRVTEGRLLREIMEVLKRRGDERFKLRKVGLAKCSVGDSEVFDLLQMLGPNCTLNLAHNADLTSTSLWQLLHQQPPLKHLDVYGCDSIFKYFDMGAKDMWTLSETCLSSFTISLNCDGEKACIKALQKIWKERYKEKAATLTEMRSFVKFHVL